MSRIIAVSAPVGGGKSSLVRGLARAFEGATAIHFDHYETLTERPVEEMKSWLRDGGNVDELVIERLPEDLARLKSGTAVVDPTGLPVPPGDYIFFETPFARQHPATGALIDMSIWIDTPLDVALARNLREFTRRPEMSADLGSWLGPYLDSYLDVVRDLLLLQREMVGGHADLVLDGMTSIEANVERARHEILMHIG